jgi:Holliday junction resolvase RusA-like endonuclease
VKALSVVLDIPASALSPNAHAVGVSRGALFAKRARIRAARHYAGVMALDALKGSEPPRWRRARLQIAWYAQRERWKPDADNAIARVKHYLDGLRDAGVLDDDDRLTIEPPLIDVDAEHPRVLLHVTGMDEEASDAA